MNVEVKDSVRSTYGRNSDKWGTILHLDAGCAYVDYGGQVYVEGDFYQDAYWVPISTIVDTKKGG